MRAIRIVEDAQPKTKAPTSRDCSPTHADAGVVGEIAETVGELAVREERVAALRYAMSAIEPLLRAPTDELRIDLRQRVFRKAFFSGAGYQVNDFEVVDYNQYELAPGFPLFRGPAVSDDAIGEGRYFCVIGAAQTFGRLVRRPWPLLLSDAIGLPVLNLSRGGAGPDVFLDRALIDLARGARFVVLQVMSGRSVGCADYPGGRRIVRDSKPTTLHRRDALEELWQRDPAVALEYVHRWNTNYEVLYQRLRAAIDRPMLLLWISNREPDAWQPEKLLKELDLGDFPQLVGRELYENVARLFEERIELVAGPSSELPLSRTTGTPCPYLGSRKKIHTEFHYYPSTAHHEGLAARLSSWAKKHRGRAPRPKHQLPGPGAESKALHRIRPIGYAGAQISRSSTRESGNAQPGLAGGEMASECVGFGGEAGELTDFHAANRKKSGRDIPKVCFVIARPRSGTTVFSKMLSSHPRVVCVGEIFNQSNERSYFHFLKNLVPSDPDCLFPGNATRNFLTYVQGCRNYATAKKQNCKVVVLDVKYDQAHLLCEAWWKIGQLPRLLFLLREKKWRVIDIHRNDVVGLCISNQVAMETKIYHSNALPEGEKQSARIRINPKQILREIRATREVYDAIEEHFAGRREYKKLSYEKMFDLDGTFSAQMVDEISEFLGVHNYFDRSPKLQKLLSDDVLHHVENAAELREILEAAEARERDEAENDRRGRNREQNMSRRG